MQIPSRVRGLVLVPIGLVGFSCVDAIGISGRCMLFSPSGTVFDYGICAQSYYFAVWIEKSPTCNRHEELRHNVSYLYCMHTCICSTYEVYNYRWLELKRAVRLVALLAALLLHVVLASRLVCEA